MGGSWWPQNLPTWWGERWGQGGQHLASPVLRCLLLTSLPSAAKPQEPSALRLAQQDQRHHGLYLPMRLAAPVPALSCTSTKSKLQSSCVSRLKLWKCRSMTCPTGTEICHRHSCRAGGSRDTHETRLFPMAGCLPPCPPSPCTCLHPTSIPSLTCWCGYGWGWFGVEKCPSKAVSGPPHSGGTHTHIHMQLYPLLLSLCSVSLLPCLPPPITVPSGRALQQLRAGVTTDLCV